MNDILTDNTKRLVLLCVIIKNLAPLSQHNNFSMLNYLLKTIYMHTSCDYSASAAMAWTLIKFEIHHVGNTYYYVYLYIAYGWCMIIDVLNNIPGCCTAHILC